MTQTPTQSTPPVGLFYRDRLDRQTEKQVARTLLSGEIVCRAADFLLPTGNASNALFTREGEPTQSIPVHSVLYFCAPSYQCGYLDALTALLVRDRLNRLIRFQRRSGKAAERTEAALSFCKGSLVLIRHLDPRGYALSVDGLYPAATARPRRTLATTLNQAAP